MGFVIKDIDGVWRQKSLAVQDYALNGTEGDLAHNQVLVFDEDGYFIIETDPELDEDELINIIDEGDTE